MYCLALVVTFISAVAFAHPGDNSWEYMVFTQTWAPASCAQIEVCFLKFIT